MGLQNSVGREDFFASQPSCLLQNNLGPIRFCSEPHPSARPPACGCRPADGRGQGRSDHVSPVDPTHRVAAKCRSAALQDALLGSAGCACRGQIRITVRGDLHEDCLLLLIHYE